MCKFVLKFPYLEAVLSHFKICVTCAFYKAMELCSLIDFIELDIPF